MPLPFKLHLCPDPLNPLNSKLQTLNSKLQTLNSKLKLPTPTDLP